MNHFPSFIKNPYNCEKAQVNWLRLFGLFVFYFWSAMLFGSIICLLRMWLGFSHPGLEDSSFYEKLLIAVLFAPVAEEFVFRYLVKFRIRRYLVFLLVASFLAFRYLIHQNYTLPILLLGVVVVGAFLMYRGADAFQRDFKWIYYLSCISFGLVHITNFQDMETSYYLLTPLLVAPQICLGFILGYIRVYYGFIYGILFHAVVKAIVSLLGG